MRIGIKTGKKVIKPLAKSFEEKVSDIIQTVNEIAEMQKARGHKYVKREGSQGNYKYWYRLPDGSLGSKADLNASTKGKKREPEKGKGKKGEFSAGDRVTGTDHFGHELTGEIVNVSPKHGTVTIKEKNGSESQLYTKTLKKVESSAEGETEPEKGDGNGAPEKTRPKSNYTGGTRDRRLLRVKDDYAAGKIDFDTAVREYMAIYPKLGKEDAEKVVKHQFEQPKGKKLGIRVSGKGSGKEGSKGNSNLSVGETISGTDIDGNEVSGKITAIGKDGVTIDHQFHVEHGKVKKDAWANDFMRRVSAAQDKLKNIGERLDKIEKENTEKEQRVKDFVANREKELAAKNDKTFVPPEKFTAAEWSKQWADQKATPDEAGVEYILQSFGREGKEIAQKIRETEAKLKGRPITQKQYCTNNGKGESARYTPEREQLHGRIMQELLSPDKLRMARPDDGQEPTMMILGGRGGSGKSWFKNNVYDPSRYVVLDADEIKSRLPEYQGWNANDVHEESSDILEQMVGLCIRERLNIVLDVTMKTAESALAKVLRFKAAGYKTEAHYMHLPAQEAAKRAVGRFRGDHGDFSGRYVPVNRVLENTTNEDSFDQVRKLVDKWSFRDNNVKRGEKPILISEGKKEVKK